MTENICFHYGLHIFPYINLFYFKLKAEQEVPDWLEEVAETALGTGYGPKGGRFASKDTRDVSQLVTYLNKSNNYYCGG